MAARPASFYLLGLRFLEQLLDVSGLWWSGVHLPLWWSGLAQVGGAVWRRGGVDGWPNLGYALIPSEYVFAKDGGGDCWVCRTGLSSMRVNGRQVYTLGFLDEARRCVDKVMALFMDIPLIWLGVAMIARIGGFRFDLCIPPCKVT
jgi:hypothetical protein